MVISVSIPVTIIITQMYSSQLCFVTMTTYGQYSTTVIKMSYCQTTQFVWSGVILWWNRGHIPWLQTICFYFVKAEWCIYASVKKPSLVQIMACPLSAPCHNLSQCWNIVNRNLRNTHQWNLKQNSHIFIQENAFENVICEMMTISSRPRCVKYIRIFFTATVVHPGSSKWNKNTGSVAALNSATRFYSQHSIFLQMSLLIRLVEWLSPSNTLVV